ncbi:MAG: pyrroline-5-carboxylate reductase [Dermatophilaceae bacterium]
MRHLAVLGAGIMGSAILSAALDQGAYRLPDVRATTLDDGARAALEERGVAVVGNAEAVAEADVVLVAVKPDAVRDVLADIRYALPHDALVISVAAGVRLSTLEGGLRVGTAVIRVMPNTPVLVGQGMLVLSAGQGCSPEQVARAKELLAACGVVRVLPEKLQDAVTGVSGSGPAYVFAFVDALIEGGVVAGLSRADATQLAVQTVAGAAELLRATGTHPALLREQVTSPGGTTAEALRVLDAAGMRAAVVDAVQAAVRRSRELGG